MEKTFWEQIAANGFAVPAGFTASDLWPDLVDGLASIDPDLRDRLCYEIICEWIATGQFGPDLLRSSIPRLLANLRAGIGQGENDQVFGRTFSVLILGEIVACDRKGPFLTDDEFAAVFAAGLRYLAEETDLRGFVPEKGWAHAAAHTADLLLALASNPRTGAGELLAILDAIGAKLQAPTPYAFVAKEEYRLGKAVLAVIRRELLPVAQAGEWLRSLSRSDEQRQAFIAGQELAREHNLVAFLAALHAMITYQELPAPVKAGLLPEVHAALKSRLPYAL